MCRYSSGGLCAKHLGPHLEKSSAGLRDALLLRAIDNHQKAVNSWEAKFLASCMDWIEEHGTLTDNQRAKAEEIRERLDG